MSEEQRMDANQEPEVEAHLRASMNDEPETDDGDEVEAHVRADQRVDARTDARVD
jgi:hypothetical protein